MANYKKQVRNILDTAHELKKQIPTVEKRIVADRQDGFPQRNGDQIGKPIGKSDPTANIALGPKDEIEEMEARFGFHLAHAGKHIKLALQAAHHLKGLSQQDGQRLNASLKEKVAVCMNCEELVTGSEGDRLRMGRCNTCYMYHRRKGYDRQTGVQR